MLTTALVVGTILFAGALGPAHAEAQRPTPDTTSGYPITDPLVVRRCAGCHAKDSTGGLGRLSYLRKTPEGWEASVRRMASLSNVRLDPADARAVVKYFSNHQGLAPAEVRPGRFEIERSATTIATRPTPSPSTPAGPVTR